MKKFIYIFLHPPMFLSEFKNKLLTHYSEHFQNTSGFQVFFVNQFYNDQNEVLYDFTTQNKIRKDFLLKLKNKFFSYPSDWKLHFPVLEKNSSKTEIEKSNIDIIELDLNEFLAEQKQKGEDYLDYFGWKVEKINNKFCFLTGNSYNSDGIHCHTIGAKRFLSQMHFLHNASSDDIYVGIDHNTCILDKCSEEVVLYKDAITELLKHKSGNNFVLGMEKATTLDFSVQPKRKEKTTITNALYKFVIISHSIMEKHFYNPFLSSFLEDVSFLSKINERNCRKLDRLWICKYDTYKNLNIKFNQLCNKHLDPGRLPEITRYRENYQKYFFYLIQCFVEKDYIVNFITFRKNQQDDFIRPMYFQEKTFSPENNLDCDGLLKKTKQELVDMYCDRNKHYILFLSENSFKIRPDSKCYMKGYTKNAFNLLQKFSECLYDYCQIKYGFSDKKYVKGKRQRIIKK